MILTGVTLTKVHSLIYETIEISWIGWIPVKKHSLDAQISNDDI